MTVDLLLLGQLVTMLYVVSQPFEKRVPDFALRRFRSILDLRKQLWFDPDASVRDLLRVGLRLADQRRQSLPQFGGRRLIEAVIDLARVDQIVAFPPAEVDAVPLVAVESEAGDRQRLALSAGLLHPCAAAAGSIGAVADLRYDALKSGLARMLVHLRAVDFEALGKLNVGFGD
jgi:hypothetical protein